jgi:hypothetical protein
MMVGLSAADLTTDTPVVAPETTDPVVATTPDRDAGDGALRPDSIGSRWRRRSYHLPQPAYWPMSYPGTWLPQRWGVYRGAEPFCFTETEVLVGGVALAALVLVMVGRK